MGSFGLLCATVLKNSLRAASGARRAGVIVGELTRIQILEPLAVVEATSGVYASGGGFPPLASRGGTAQSGKRSLEASAPPQHRHSATCTHTRARARCLIIIR